LILCFCLYIYSTQIICKRGSAAVVSTRCCFYGKGQIFHLSRAETTLPINTKFRTIDYVGEMKRFRNLVEIDSTGGVSHVGEIYSVTVFSSCFVDQATYHNSQQILMYYGSKDFVWRKDVYPITLLSSKLHQCS